MRDLLGVEGLGKICSTQGLVTLLEVASDSSNTCIGPSLPPSLMVRTVQIYG